MLPISPQTSTPSVKKNPQKPYSFPLLQNMWSIQTVSWSKLVSTTLRWPTPAERENVPCLKSWYADWWGTPSPAWCSILRASQQGQEVRSRSKHEVTAMARRMVEYYPMPQDKDNTLKHVRYCNFVVYYFLHLDYEVCIYVWLTLFICDRKRLFKKIYTRGCIIWSLQERGRGHARDGSA